MRVALVGLLLSVAGVASASAQDAAHGAKVYTAQKCNVCHSVSGKGNAKGPLDDVGKRLSADDIRAWIVDPAAMTAKTKAPRKPPMPPKYSKLPKEEVDALVAYMLSLKG